MASSRFLARIPELWRSSSKASRWRVVLGLLALVFVGFLIFADKPWHVAAEAGDKIRVRHYVAIYGWWAALANLFITAGLAVLAPWWCGPVHNTGRREKIPYPRWFWPCVLAAMLLSGFFGLPRMTQSFWDDEELTVRYSLFGRYQRDAKTDEVEFRKVTWQDAFFDYRTPNNHILHTVLAKASSEAWIALVKPQGLPFSEWSMRVPAFVFGLLGIATLAWFLKECGRPGAGVVAAFLLAAHPWHLRYVAESRGYSMVIFFVPLLLVLWMRAVSRGEWKWWAAFALAQFGILYTYPGTLAVLVVLNVLTIPLFLLSRESAGPPMAQLGRWFCANSLAAIAIFQLMLPLYPQSKLYFAAERTVILGWPWIRNALCYLTGGVPWDKTGEPTLKYPELWGPMVAHPVAFWLFAILTLVFVVWGLVWMATRSRMLFAAVLILVLPPVMLFMASRIGQYIIYEPYVISLLPGIVAFASLGIANTAALIAKAPAGRILAPIAAACVVVAYFAYTMPFRSWMTAHSLQGIRESVEMTRPTLNPKDPANDTVLTASFCIPPYLYDAHAYRLDSADQFIAMLRRADAENKPLWLNLGMPWSARQYSPKMWAMTHEEMLFEPPIPVQGFEPSLDRMVVKYRPGSAKNFNFSKYEGTDR